MAARQGRGADGVVLPGSGGRAAACGLSVHRQQSGRGRAGQAPPRGADPRSPAAAARRRRSVGRRARAGTAGRRIRPGRRPRPPQARAAGAADCRDRAAKRPGARGRRRRGGVARRGAAPDRCLAVRPEGPRRSRTASTSTAARRRRRRLARASAPGTSAKACSTRSTAAVSRPGPAGSPHRERRDVLPTGRNMFTADPRMLPTPTAMDLGRMAADEGAARLHADARRDAARAGDRPLGQRDAAHRRRGDRAGPRTDGLPPGLGPERPAA